MVDDVRRYGGVTWTDARTLMGHFGSGLHSVYFVLTADTQGG